jgi:hypothetical protein
MVGDMEISNHDPVRDPYLIDNANASPLVGAGQTCGREQSMLRCQKRRDPARACTGSPLTQLLDGKDAPVMRGWSRLQAINALITRTPSHGSGRGKPLPGALRPVRLLSPR